MASDGARVTTSAADGGTEWTQVTQRHYDPDEDRELTTVIVYAIADARDVSPLAVTSPPLYDVLDIAGIESAFFGTNDRRHDAAAERRPGSGSVEFDYDDLQVTVRNDGWVCVSERRPTGPGDED